MMFLFYFRILKKAYEIVCQEGSNLSDLGELVVVPLYPKKCALFKPNDGKQKKMPSLSEAVVLVAPENL